MDKRYRKRVERHFLDRERKEFEYLDRLDLNSWFDWWHTHPDLFGKGDRFPENRLRVMQMSYGLLQEIRVRVSSRTEPLQYWMTVAASSYEDAVWMHSPNPNGSPFPHDTRGVEWECTELPALNELVDLEIYRIGKVTYSSEVVFLVAPRELPGMVAGTPL